MDVIVAINARRTTRRFKSKEVRKELILKVFEAGRLAPSAKNQQNLKFVAITDPAMREEIRPYVNGQNFAIEAPVLIAVCALDNKRMMKCDEPAGTIDAAIALSFMVLRAQELGLSTCWMGNFNAEGIRKIIKAPENAKIVALTPLGYSDEEHSLRLRKHLDEFVSFNGFYSE